MIFRTDSRVQINSFFHKKFLLFESITCNVSVIFFSLDRRNVKIQKPIELTLRTRRCHANFVLKKQNMYYATRIVIFKEKLLHAHKKKTIHYYINKFTTCSCKRNYNCDANMVKLKEIVWVYENNVLIDRSDKLGANLRICLVNLMRV